MALTNAQKQARWRERQNAYASIARAELSGPAKRKRDRLEVERTKLTMGWCKQLTLLADACAYFGRLKDAPASEWRSQEMAEALTRRRFHESTAAAYDTLLRSVEQEIAAIEGHAETMAESRRLLARHRGKR
jgi:hypothetical protein